MDAQLTRLTSPRPALVILHVSGPLFGGPGNRLGDSELCRQLPHDITLLARDHGVHPDLLIATGNLAHGALPRYYEKALRFLAMLAEAAGISRDQVVIIPGSQDVSRPASLAHFLTQESLGEEPVKPYREKWANFAAAFNGFYATSPGARPTFSLNEPYNMFEVFSRRVVVAALNSTIAESHLDDYGSFTEKQLDWFANGLDMYRSQGLLRIAAVHRADVRDASDLNKILGEKGLVNLLISGEPSDSPTLQCGVPVLAGGNIGRTGRYQLIAVRQEGITRVIRLHTADEGWRADRHEKIEYPIRDAPYTFPPALSVTDPQPVSPAVRVPVPDAPLLAESQPGQPMMNNFYGPVTFAARDAYSAGGSITQGTPATAGAEAATPETRQP